MIYRTKHRLRLHRVFCRIGANQTPAQGHEQRRTYPLVHDVGDEQSKLSPMGRNKVVEIARHLVGRFQAGDKGPAFHLGHVGW